MNRILPKKLSLVIKDVTYGNPTYSLILMETYSKQQQEYIINYTSLICLNNSS